MLLILKNIILHFTNEKIYKLNILLMNASSYHSSFIWLLSGQRVIHYFQRALL